MPNYLPKGRERMRALGKVGGTKSGESRRDKAFQLDVYRAILFRNCSWEEFWASTPVELVTRHILRQKLRYAGGSHQNDWRCPECWHSNSIKRRMCAQCWALAPANGRMTREARRVREKEHEVEASLRKHGV